MRNHQLRMILHHPNEATCIVQLKRQYLFPMEKGAYFSAEGVRDLPANEVSGLICTNLSVVGFSKGADSRVESNSEVLVRYVL